MAHVPAQVRRRTLVDAAIQVISRDGVERATTRRIAEQAGASLASLHYAFADKQSLFAEVYEDCCLRAEERFSTLPVEGLGLTAAVGLVLDGFLDWLVEEPEPQLAQLQLLMWAVQNEGGRALVVEVYDRYFAMVRAVLTRADQRAPATGSLEQLARLLVAVVDGLQLQYFTFRDPRALRRERDAALPALQAFVMAARTETSSQEPS